MDHMRAFEDVQSIRCDQNLTKQSSHSVVHQTATIIRSPRKSMKLFYLFIMNIVQSTHTQSTHKKRKKLKKNKNKKKKIMKYMNSSLQR